MERNGINMAVLAGIFTVVTFLAAVKLLDKKEVSSSRIAMVSAGYIAINICVNAIAWL